MDKQQKARVTAMEADRDDAKLSYRGLAQKAGVSDGNIRDAVKGRKDMGEGNWGKVASALPGGKLEALLQAAGIEIPGPPAHAVRQEGDADASRITVPFSALRLAPNYRTSADQEQLEGLAASILDKGVMQNLVVRPADAKGIHEVHAGSRRFRAIELNVKAGRCEKDFPVPILVMDMADDEALAMSIVENLQREEVHPVEEAEAFRRLRDDHAWPTKRIAEALGGKDKLRYVQQRINIAEKLTPAAREALHEDRIGLDQARALWVLPPMLQDRMLANAEKQGWDAEDIRHLAARDLPAGKDAAFDVAAYDGEIYEANKTKYFVDVARFAKLQQSAIRTRIDTLKKKWGGGLVEAKYYFELHGYEKTKDKEKGVSFYLLRTHNAHGSGPKWQTIEVREGYIKASAAKKVGVEGAPAPEEAKPHGNKHLEQAHHLKTLELQRAIAEHKEGAAISMALTVVTLIGFEYGSPPAVKIHSGQRGNGQLGRQMSPQFQELETTLRPFIEKGMLRSAEEGGLRERSHIVPGREGDFFNALLDGPRSHLEKIFTLLIAVETGSFVSFPLRYGDNLLAVAAAERAGATLAGKWRMTEDYLKPYTRAQLDRVAVACLPDDADTDLPPKKGEAIAAIMNHACLPVEWLPPELQFGPRHIIEGEAAAMLGFTPTTPAQCHDEDYADDFEGDPEDDIGIADEDDLPSPDGLRETGEEAEEYDYTTVDRRIALDGEAEEELA